VWERGAGPASLLRRTGRFAWLIAGLGLMAGFALAGCGASSSSATREAQISPKAVASAPRCLPKAEVGLSRVVGAHVSEISQSPSNGRCTFRIRQLDGRRLTVVAKQDSRPQPDVRLERVAVRTTQQFADRRVFAVLQTVDGLGMDANWYPVKQQLQATDGRVLVTVTVSGTGVSQDRRRALAIAVARPYLR
jgi:hypothetical protein